eukprot:81484_1
MLSSHDTTEQLSTVQTPYKFCFISLFSGDTSYFIPQWIELFQKQTKFNTFRKILDYGLGCIYNSSFPSSLQLRMLNILPTNIKFNINKTIKKNKNKKLIQSLQFVKMRQQIHNLSKKQLIKFLQHLSNIIDIELLSSIFRFGFDRYKHQIPLNIIQSIIKTLCKSKNIPISLVTERRNSEHTLVYGYCKTFTMHICNKSINIPFEIAELCYFYYFMLYCAKHSDDFQQIFGNKFSTIYNTVSLRGIENNIMDTWHKYKTNPMLIIDNNTHSVERITPRTSDDQRFDAFGTEIIGFGQCKTWQVKVKPFVGNFNIGICEVNNFANNELSYPEFAFYGFSLVLWNGRIYYGKGIYKHKNFVYSQPTPSSHNFDEWQEKECIITMQLDMCQEIICGIPIYECSLKFNVDGINWGITMKDEIDHKKYYKLAVSFLEAQKAQILPVQNGIQNTFKSIQIWNHILKSRINGLQVPWMDLCFVPPFNSNSDSNSGVEVKEIKHVISVILLMPRMRIIVEDIYMEYFKNYSAHILLKGAISHKNILYCVRVNNWNDYYSPSYLISSILCPRYEIRGDCLYGVSCRWIHLNRITG